ncbi:hypothetical protein [Paenibacillus tundrae]|uniref:Uncharacterized protein n=1 Tax=Paenibacillus tundrae TaxID=528187 RepID=A0ABT9WB80_9BACL|nr:hypothetical protein [Paenibacillus tundrae]MDQ0170511.1 hypothetical protein [Paenibacillus tundrae]
MGNLVEHYITHNLIPILIKLGVNSNTISKISVDIDSRLCSILHRWNDEIFRSTVLLHGIEEASFYNPTANINTKALVVVCIRNSLLEDLSSTIAAAKSLGATKPLITDEQIKIITSDAITFFSNHNLSSQNIKKPLSDTFENLQTMYPITWNAMQKLSQCINFAKFGAHCVDKSNISLSKSTCKPEQFVEVQSGIDPTINHTLNEILERIEEGKQPFFFSDSFKMITRNPDKLYKIIEIILRSNAPLVTFNYYISNGYVARRAILLRPAHSQKDLEEKHKRNGGLRKVHLEIIKKMR